jgi:hypothetical protein
MTRTESVLRIIVSQFRANAPLGTYVMLLGMA